MNPSSPFQQLKSENKHLIVSLEQATETIEGLRTDNDELKARWEKLLQVCCNAEAEVEHLQNEIEIANLRFEDAMSNVSLSNTELINIRIKHTAEKAELESKIAKLVREYDVIQKNYQYLHDHTKQLNQLVEDAKVESCKIRDENSQLKQQQVNAEHLAKQVVKLQKELSELELTYCPYQKSRQYMNEKMITEFSTHLPCGTCVKCKLDAAYDIIERSTHNVKHLEAQLASLDKKIETEYACEGAQRGDRVLMCGKCLSCKSKQNDAILHQTITYLDKANEKILALKHDNDQQQKDLRERRNLQHVIESENRDLREIIAKQRDALELIARGSFFKHHKIAHECLKDVMEFKERKNII